MTTARLAWFTRAATYATAGLLSLDELRALQDEYWSDFLEDDPDTRQQWWDWERAVSDRFVPSSGRVLLIGCGSGRDLLPLLRRGCRVTALEPATRARLRAERAVAAAGLHAEFLPGRIETVPLAGVYDVAWFSWLSYSYIADARQRISALRRCAGRLSPSGCVVLNVLRHPPRDSARYAGVLVSALLRRGWRIQRGDVIQRVAGPARYSFQHFFPDGALERELAAAGLAVMDRLDAGDVVVAAPVAAEGGRDGTSSIGAADYRVSTG